THAHPETAARLAQTLGAGAIVVAPTRGLDHRGAWWEIAAETGDTRSVGDLGLHAGRGSFGLNPLAIRKEALRQQNLFDGVKGFETEEARLERIKEARRLAYESRRMAFEQRAKLRFGNAQPPKTAASATGYTLLLIVGAVIKDIVITA